MQELDSTVIGFILLIAGFLLDRLVLVEALDGVDEEKFTIILKIRRLIGRYLMLLGISFFSLPTIITLFPTVGTYIFTAWICISFVYVWNKLIKLKKDLNDEE